VELIIDSCGYSVPKYEFKEEREKLGLNGRGKQKAWELGRLI